MKQLWVHLHTSPHHMLPSLINTLRPRQNGRHFADDVFRCIFLNENIWILLKISLKFVPKGLINNIPSLVQIMAWRRPGNKPLSEPMLVSLLMHICVTRPQWVKPSTAQFILGNIVKCLYFCHLVQTVDILPHWRQGHVLSAWWMPLLLM